MQLCPIIHYITWRRSEENLPWLGLHKEILDSPCFLIPLIYSKHRTKSLIMLNYRGLGGGVKLLFFGNFYPLWLLIMTPIPDYENCKEHLPTHLTFTPHFMTFNLNALCDFSCTSFLLSYSSKLNKNQLWSNVNIGL